ncbi:MAG: ANTAR domain-containing protein [Clostridia bacterium]|nr:ANTAR domain-containing protein [Clostridia bacterium]
MYLSRIVLADSDNRSRKRLKDMLGKAGYGVVGEAKDGLAALTLIRSTQPDMVILDVNLPVLDTIDVAKIVEEGRLAPVLLLASPHQVEWINTVKDSWVMSLLFKPVNEVSLHAHIELARSKYEKLITLEREISELKENIATRKVVDKAKGILMRTKNLSEQDAFRYIQQQSMNKRVTKKAIAEAIILSYDISR